MSKRTAELREGLMSRSGALKLYVAVFALLSGFVFIEPSPAEIWILVFFPVVAHFLTVGRATLSALFLFYVPMALSFTNGYLRFGTPNYKFLLIDVYLTLTFFLFQNSIRSRGTEADDLISKAMVFWTAAAMINVLAGFAGYVLGRYIIGPVTLIGFGIRMIGFFKDPNVLGPFLVPPALYWAQRLLTTRKRLAPIALVAILTIGIVLSFSRSGWLNFACGVAILAIHYLFKGSFLQKCAIIAISVLALVALSQLLTFDVSIGTLSFQSFFQGRLGLKSYDQERFQAWLALGEIFPLAPIFGVGPGNYELYAGRSTHNTFIRFVGERGVVGLISMMIALAIIIRALVKKRVDIFIKASITGVLVNSLFVDTLHWRHLWILLALLLASESAPRRGQVNSVPQVESGKP